MASYYKTLDLPSRLLRVLLVSSGVLLSVLLGSSQAQMTLDGSLGPRGVLTGPNYRIDAAVGQIRGGNLFHSFGQFNLSRGESATFTGPNTISNILSRVTGGQQSVIDGRLQSTIPGANLYLLNPSGVLFGPNASLDISGSFHVSTADVLRFADGATFSAHIGERSTLTTAPPAAFGFLGPTPAAITVRGSSLGVSEGKAVSVVGGEIQVVGGHLVAPSGRVQIASVASSGEVLASPAEMEPNLQVDSFTRLGRLEISQGGLLDVSGNRGGTVLIRSGRLLVDRAQIFANTLGDMNGASLGLDLRITADAVIHDSDLRVSPSAAGNGGNVTVNVGSLMLTDGGRILSSSRGAGHGGTLTVAAADAIFITGRNSQGNQSGLFSNAFSLGDAGQLFISAPALTMDDGQVQAGTVSGSRGNAGGAEVRVGRLTLTGGAQIDTDTRGSGRGGDLTVSAADAISITGGNSALFSNTFGSGDTGQVSVSTPMLAIDGGKIQAAVNSQGSGNARGIRIEVGQLTLSSGAQISTSTFGSGRGGDLSVMAAEAIAITGRGSELPQTGLFSVADGSGDAGRLFVSAPRLDSAGGRILGRTLGDGNGGDIEVRVGQLRLTAGAQIFNGTGRATSGGVIGSDGPGRGGNLTVVATDSLFIAGQDQAGFASGLFSGAQIGRGNAGNVFIATPLLTLDAGGQIEAAVSRLSRGNGGSIEVQVGQLLMSNGAQISTSTFGSGQGGQVMVTATDTLTLTGTAPTGRLSGISATAGGTTVGAGAAGNIVVTAPRIMVSDGAQINSGTSGPGAGGSVMVTASDTLTLIGTAPTGRLSGIFANAQGTAIGAGAAGSIVVTAPRIMVSDGAQIISSTFGPGTGGSVMVTATDTLTLVGTTPTGFFASGILATTEGTAAGAGAAGNIVVTAPRIMVTGGAAINGSTSGPGAGGNVMVTATDTLTLTGTAPTGRLSGISATTRGTAVGAGAAGSIVVTAPRIMVSDGAQINSGTFGPGTGGSVMVTATDTLTLSGTSADGRSASNISANARGVEPGAGPAGTVTVEASKMTLTDGAQIASATFGPGQGGTVRVTATDTLTLTGTAPGGAFPSGIFATAEGQAVGAAGTVVVEARHAMLTNGARISSTTSGPGPGGAVRVTASDTLTLTGTGMGPQGAFPSSILATTEGQAVGAGAAGTVVVEARDVRLTDGAAIASTTFGPGQGGTVWVTATDTLTLTGADPGRAFPSGIFANARGEAVGAGTAGTVVVEARHVTLTDGARIAGLTSGPGQGGSVRVTATDTLTLRGIRTTPEQVRPSGIFASTEGREPGAGAAGSIMVQAPRVTLTDGAQIFGGTFGPGPGGTVRVTADDTLILTGTTPTGAFASGIFATAEGTAEGAGAAGSIVVQAPRIMVSGGVRISSSTSGPGAGGSVMMTATDTIDIAGQGSELAARTTAQGRGGDVLLQAHQVQLTDGATISAGSTGLGNAGNITIATGDTFLSTNSRVVTLATQADGGNIQITTPTLVRLRDSTITAEVGGGISTVGGNITIDPQFVLLQNSQIVANAFQGQGGNIRIQAQQVFLADPASRVDASSALGINGQVAIQAPVTSISGAVAPLPQAFVQTAELLRTRCVERLREGTVSRLVVGGRDGVPLEPGSLLLSPLERVEQEAGVQDGKRQPQNPEPQHAWVSSAQAHAREEWEGACARWMGQPGTPGSPKRRR